VRIFTEQYWHGVSHFNDGKLPEALRRFRKALEEASQPQHWLAASFHIQRILERRGDSAGVNKLRLEGSKRLKEAGQYWLWAETKALALAAWSDYREGRPDAAEKIWLKVLGMIQGHGLLDVLGEVHNGLAEIEKIRGAYPAAMDHYLEALNAWLLTDYFYGFQAVYFNIAALQRNWGDVLAKQGNGPAAKQRYKTATEWAEACLRLCHGMAIGDDTAENEILLSNLNRHLGKFDKAEQFARDAQRMAEANGNQRSIALSARVLARALMAKGQNQKAKEVVVVACNSIRPAYRKFLGSRVLKFLAEQKD
jgi:tetratricopeptide (TPR) repeat protein